MDATATDAEKPRPIKIFICYAREDEHLLNLLTKHLRPLVHEGAIQLWYDREIRVGSAWEPTIKEQLESAQLILLLVSPDFMDSNYCYSVEMRHALERHQRGEVTVIPIILRPTYWHLGPLGRLQALPLDARPVTDAADPDKALYDVTEGIYQVVQEMTVTHATSAPADRERSQEHVKPEHVLLRENSISASLEQPRLLRTMVGHTGPVASLVMSPDGKTLVSGSWDATIKIWDLANGRNIRTLQGHKRPIRSIAMSPDGETLVSGSDDTTIKVWSLASGREMDTLRGHKDWVLCVAIGPDGETLASGSWNETIKVWSLASGQELRTLSGHTGFAARIGMHRLKSVSAIVISADGETLVSGSGEEITLWDLTNGQRIRTLDTHLPSISSLALSSDGETLVSGAQYDIKDIEHNMIKVWNLATGQNIRTLHTGRDGTDGLVISPDGKRLVSATYSGATLWNLLTAQKIATLAGSTTNCKSLAISPDGKTLASGFWDGTIEVWRI